MSRAPKKTAKTPKREERTTPAAVAEGRAPTMDPADAETTALANLRAGFPVPPSVLEALGMSEAEADEHFADALAQPVEDEPEPTEPGDQPTEPTPPNTAQGGDGQTQEG